VRPLPVPRDGGLCQAVELFVDGLYLYEGMDGDLYGYGSSFIQALETSILLDKEKRGEN